MKIDSKTLDLLFEDFKTLTSIELEKEDFDYCVKETNEIRIFTDYKDWQDYFSDGGMSFRDLRYYTVDPAIVKEKMNFHEYYLTSLIYERLILLSEKTGYLMKINYYDDENPNMLNVEYTVDEAYKIAKNFINAKRN